MQFSQIISAVLLEIKVYHFLKGFRHFPNIDFRIVIF